MGHSREWTLGVLAVVVAVVSVSVSCSSEEKTPPPKVYRPKLVDVAITKHYTGEGPIAVAVSDDGRRQWSRDFVEWTAGGNAPPGHALRTITAGRDRFLIG